MVPAVVQQASVPVAKLPLEIVSGVHPVEPVTVRVTVAVWVSPPPVPVTVIG